MKTYKIAAMGGDGIGPEVVKAGVQVLNVCAERDGGFKLEFKNFDWGSDYYRKHGVMMPRGWCRPAPQVRCHPVRRRRCARHSRSHNALRSPARHLPTA